MSVDSSRARKRTLIALAFVALLAVGTGCSESSSSPPTSAPSPAEPAAAPPAGKRPTVEFLGPDRLTRPTDLEARARAVRGSRVVAVTFLLDGRPLGSDTTKPYRLDVDPALLPRGDHRIRVEAVDSLGRRGLTKPSGITIEPSGSDVIEVSPGDSFARVRDELDEGGVTVRLAPGRYEVDELQLGSDTRLVGSGRRTVLSAPSGKRYWALVVAKGSNIRITDLTIDGGGDGRGDAEDGGFGVAVFDRSKDVRLQRLRLIGVRGHGVNTWGAHSSISLQDSHIESDGKGEAGFVALGSDETRDTSVIRTRVRGFTSFGILLQQQDFGRPAADLHGVVLDNVVSDIRDPARDGCWTEDKDKTPGCGTDEGGIWTGGVEAAVIGNTVHRARWDGIQTVGSSTRTTIVHNKVYDTRTGIYIERSTNHSHIARNLIVDALTGMQVEWLHRGGGSKGNTFAFNRIVSSERGMFVDVGGDENRIVGNVFVGGSKPVITLQGSSRNLVRGNVACRMDAGPFVKLESANYEDGRDASSRGNRVRGNRDASSC